MPKKWVSTTGGDGYWEDFTPVTRDSVISDFYKNSIASLTPDAGTTPFVNSFGAGTQPVVHFTSGGKQYYLTPALGKEVVGPYGQVVMGENGIEDAPGVFSIEPTLWKNWSNDSNWGSNVSGLPVMKADWAADLVKNSPYGVFGDYSGGGWVSDKPIQTTTWENPKDESWVSQFLQGPAIPLAGFVGAGAFNSGGLGNFFSSFGGGASGAAGGVSGGGMFDPFADFGFDYFSGAGNYNLPYSDAIEGLIDLTNQGMSGSQAVQSLSQMNPAWTQTTLEFLANNPSQIGSYLNNMGSIRNLLSGDGIGGLGLNGLRGLVPSGGGFMDQAMSSLPVLAAIDYAKSQGPFDTSRLESLYGQYNPNASAFSYDQNTQAGRRALEGSLASRGVLGSSFGNMDMTNFDTTRELGRNALVNQSAGVAGGLASNILDAQVKSRALKNDLYGRSLLALGNVFGGRQSPTFSLGGF